MDCSMSDAIALGQVGEMELRLRPLATHTGRPTRLISTFGVVLIPGPTELVSV